MSAIADTGIVPVPEVSAGRRPTFQLLRSALGLWRTRIGLMLAGALVAIAVVGPYLAPHAPTAFVGQPNTRPSNLLFGTDHIGQDVWSRFLSGGGQILAVSALATLLGLVLGVIVGLISAYSRNWLDDVLMRAMDVILAFPQIMLALVAVTTLGVTSWLIVLAVGITTMPRVARVTRGAAQPVVERDFVAAAEALGVARWRILFGEILPNILSPLMVEASLRLTYAIALIAALAFLGFSTDPNGANWGTMIQENQLALVSQPWGVVLPVVERDFVAAAEALGVARWRILLGEILPNILSPLMVEASLRLTYSIGLIAALAFLGFSTDPNGANWGTMIQENQLALVSQPWGVVLPVVAITLLTIGTSLVGDGVARAAIGIDRGRAAE